MQRAQQKADKVQTTFLREFCDANLIETNTAAIETKHNVFF